jgi:hypothetical protein
MKKQNIKLDGFCEIDFDKNQVTILGDKNLDIPIPDFTLEFGYNETTDLYSVLRSDDKNESLVALFDKINVAINAVSNGLGFALEAVHSLRPYSIEEYVRDWAHRAGESCAYSITEYAFGGRCTGGHKENAERIINSYDDGDPVFYDMIPNPLSGEWADELTPKQLFCESLNIDENDEYSQLENVCELLGISDDMYSLQDRLQEIYQMKYQDSCANEIVRQCQEILKPE